jgi:hypothetical protein
MIETFCETTCWSLVFENSMFSSGRRRDKKGGMVPPPPPAPTSLSLTSLSNKDEHEGLSSYMLGLGLKILCDVH